MNILDESRIDEVGSSQEHSSGSSHSKHKVDKEGRYKYYDSSDED